MAGIDDVQITAKADSALVPLPEGRSYLGFIFAAGEHADAVEEALRHAHAAASICASIVTVTPIQ